MKTRQGFVSNSSSSSFVCDVCGNDASGWDLCLEQAEMFECENGHTFCENHFEGDIEKTQRDYVFNCLKEDYENKNESDLNSDWEKVHYKVYQSIKNNTISEDDLYDYIINNDFEFRYEVPRENCPICSMTVICSKDLKNYLMKLTKITNLEVLTEIKKENKRRRKVYDNEYINYACKHLNRNEKDIKQEIFDKYDKYEQFEEDLML